MRPKKFQSGQSLVEVLVAVAIGGILVIGAASIIAPVLKSSTSVRRSQTAAALGKELADNLKNMAEANWHNIDSSLSDGATKYYINTTSGVPFAIATGTQPVLVITGTASTTYTRYFYLDSVNRDASGVIVSSSGDLDPSTRKATIVYQWPTGGQGTIVEYLTRSRANILWQTDWSGGPNIGGPVSTTNPGNSFSVATSVDYTTTTGSLRIQGL
jgi:prepilin-type N-terminal cleavage/methylation domain-containing protein